MRLRSQDGAYLDLCPEGYEFAPTGDPDDDAWLVITAQVGTAAGQEWQFTQPCLTIDEAQDLGSWLDRVASGRVASIPGDRPRGRFAFIEPNIAFSVAAVSTERIQLRVHFSHESMPPWQPHHDWPDYQAFAVVLDVGTADLRMAATQWRTEIAAFPPRP